MVFSGSIVGIGLCIWDVFYLCVFFFILVEILTCVFNQAKLHNLMVVAYNPLSPDYKSRVLYCTIQIKVLLNSQKHLKHMNSAGTAGNNSYSTSC